MAIRGALTGSKVFPAKFSNTCWSLVDTNDGVKVGATYKATDEKSQKLMDSFPKLVKRQTCVKLLMRSLSVGMLA